MPRLLLSIAGLIGALVLAGTAGGADTSPPTITVTSSFAGMTDVDGGQLDPPDMGLAAGPGYLIEMVNLAERIWKPTAGSAPQLVTTESLSSFYGTGSDTELTDPRVEYDALSGRWFASVSTEDADTVLLAVSRTSDPTGGWTVSSFPAPGCADQPRLGLDDNVVVIGATIFSNCNGSFSQELGGELWVVNKSQLMAGSTSPAFTANGPHALIISYAPVQSLSSTPTEYVVSVDNPSSDVVHLVTVDGTPPAPVQVQPATDIPITPLSSLNPALAQQPPDSFGRPQPLMVNDDRILDSVWENGSLWFSANSSCIPTGDSFQRSCSRIGEISTATNTLDWDFDIGDAGAYTFFPAIRPDGAGNLVVVYGESSSTISPQLRAVVRAPDGTFSTPSVLASSAGPHLDGRDPRYGDYFGAARDPADPATVWVSGEIGSMVPGGLSGWNTAVASIQVSGGGATTPVVTTVVVPPRLKALASSGRHRTTSRLRYTAVDAGKSVREQVIVRNPLGTIVYQSTTAKNSISRSKTYSFPWRAQRPGRYSFCVKSIVSSGAKSTPSCAVATIS